MSSAGGRNPICSMTRCVFSRQFHIFLWSHGFTFKFSHKDLLRLPCFFIWYKLQPRSSFCLHVSFISHVDPGWNCLFFSFFPPLSILLIKMALSWTTGAWTLLAALALLSCCCFNWCEASRTSSSSSGGSTQEQGPSSLERVKRGWVWNQFFVVEEYTGTEPLYVGKVGLLFLLIFILWKECVKHK